MKARFESVLGWHVNGVCESQERYPWMGTGAMFKGGKPVHSGPVIYDNTAMPYPPHTKLGPLDIPIDSVEDCLRQSRGNSNRESDSMSMRPDCWKEGWRTVSKIAVRRLVQSRLAGYGG